MTTDAFTAAARAEAGRVSPPPPTDSAVIYPLAAVRSHRRGAFISGAEWARDHLAAQGPTEAEVLAALNAHGVAVSPKMHPAPSLDYWGERPAEAMRAALTAAKEARE